MHIDCDRCEMRGLACSDCVVSVLLGEAVPELGGEEQRAIGVLSEAGLVPPLRMAASDDEPRKSAETPARDLRGMRSAG